MRTKITRLRESRKLEHINLALNLSEGPRTSGLEDVLLIHQALPELNYTDMDLSCLWLGKRLEAPILINAITGGAKDAAAINASLAKIAKDFGIAMAVGSQTAALENVKMEETYSIARQVNPDGILLANVGSSLSWKKALQAVEMIEADGLQLHLNALQELLMPEGDRCFKGILENISQIITRCSVPVIVKEVGFGLSKETVKRLYEAGVTYFDVGGQGGTNFAAIENYRNKSKHRDTFLDWGIPTASSLLEVASLGLPIQTVASGGIRTGVEIIKALRLGANVTGIAGSFLKVLLKQSQNDLAALVETLISEARIALLLTGAGNISNLKSIPFVLKGGTLEWAKQRDLYIDF